jgi:cobalt-zinc-cadmium efflux system outer membrane protein
MRRAFLAFTLLSGFALAQESAPPTSFLSDLLKEAREKSPAILAANAVVRTATFGPVQAGAFPDTEFMVQSLSVGRPWPLAGFHTSDFAYIGFGASQELPYPGKRGLRKQVSEQEIGIVRAGALLSVADVLERVKISYFALARVQAVLALLQRNRNLVAQIEQAVQSRYRVGTGTQQDVLRAQLERTRLLNEITLEQRNAAQLQAQLRALLNRGPNSPDILAEPLTARNFADIESQIAGFTENNPELRLRSEEKNKAVAEAQLANREKKPDFGAQYMWQHTSDQFSDYYMATFSLRLPNRKRVNAAVGQAEARKQQVEAAQLAQRRQIQGALEAELATLRATEQQIQIYRDGLMPQSETAFNAGMVGYRAGRQDYQSLLASYSDTLRLGIAYQELLAEHETTLARIERMIGGDLK